MSGRSDLDGSPLMQQVFSPRNPQIILSDDQDEQQGFMWLFAGAVMAIRNPKAHKITDVTDPQRTLEWLSFASVLHRVLDDIENLSNS
ncbi:TIGR02391 family protein [Paenibacillus sp. PCH8]|uniref:TIGR02391 family protein n=1 Tax=Paenibacillus sp. PCH8 TaxID=2066524 RepID=UPI0035BE3822